MENGIFSAIKKFQLPKYKRPVISAAPLIFSRIVATITKVMGGHKGGGRKLFWSAISYLYEYTGKLQILGLINDTERTNLKRVFSLQQHVRNIKYKIIEQRNSFDTGLMLSFSFNYS